MQFSHSMLGGGIVVAVVAACSSTSVTNANNTSIGGSGDGGAETGGITAVTGAVSGGGTTAVGGKTGTAGSNATSSAGSSATATGGSSASAGASSLGGTNAQGGTVAADGGTTTSTAAAGKSSVGGTTAVAGGGTTTAVGGAATGGRSTAGSSTGGAAAGGTATGGAAAGGTATGGRPATGGIAATGGTTGDTTPPTVTKITPTNGATGLGMDTTIQITFSEAMDQTSVKSALTISGVNTSGLSLSWNAAGTVVTIAPSGGLLYATGTDPNTTTARIYTVTLSTAAADLSSNYLKSAFTASFSTARKITQAIAPSLMAHYDTYGIGYFKNPMAFCGTDDYAIGSWSGSVSSGTYYAAAEFDLTIPANIIGVPSATLSALQGTPTNNFYSTSTVVLNELSYKALGDGTNASWIFTQPVTNAFGTFSSSTAISNPSLDITSVFAAEVGSGQRNFLYTWAPSNNALATATFRCGYTYLNLTYVTP